MLCRTSAAPQSLAWAVYTEFEPLQAAQLAACNTLVTTRACSAATKHCNTDTHRCIASIRPVAASADSTRRCVQPCEQQTACSADSSHSTPHAVAAHEHPAAHESTTKTPLPSRRRTHSVSSLRSTRSIEDHKNTVRDLCEAANRLKILPTRRTRERRPLFIRAGPESREMRRGVGCPRGSHVDPIDRPGLARISASTCCFWETTSTRARTSSNSTFLE